MVRQAVWFCRGFLFFTVLFVSGAAAQAPFPPEIAKYGTPDMIVFNGKIVSMDDNGTNTNVGHVYEAMAVKGDRIMALGTNQRIQSWASYPT